MNQEILKGNWHEIKGEVQKRFARLTDDDLGVIEAQNEKIYGYLQKYYGYTKEEASRQVQSLLTDLSEKADQTVTNVLDYSMEKCSQIGAWVREPQKNLEEKIRERPCASLAISLCTGVIIGLFLSRR